ncbi:MAG TPA: polymer-forming cytoskeletal protein [Flavobacterium sp.]|jgi:cytoskeletal protein CcmA (bactofilin family)|uniref:bactofilin family protein n=1 Tax=Flavobacterium sp. TaxID=239 RepID=UPI002C0DA2AF|nr:polymer-forming cytoskeletal protein [Flavobacterium sp.]MCA0348413.1 polymer-forming cytoskeletal protein [Bacteroidota bacterium]HPW97463.1 polymer-forming cytoskeletal protein [Flavobacterium sp.]HQA73046.1 polymer-forming cytoskeletal protein [Flavobacterium sp.]
MFEKRSKPYTDLLGKTNRIVEGTTINGNVVSATDIRLDGQLIGNLQSKGKLVIGPTGNIKGDVICRNADIEGLFEGKIQVQEILNIKSKAHIKGDVICGKLSVEPGAEFSATCAMKPQVKNITTDGKSEQEKIA